MTTTGLSAAALLSSLKARRQDLTFPERADAPELLEKTARFLEARETSNPPDATHQVLKDFGDWWCNCQKNTKKLAIAETGTLEVFYEYIAKMYELGVPLTLGEKRTDHFSFFQDIEIRGGRENKIDFIDLVGPESPFLRFLGRLMAELYPRHKQFQVIVMDASGKSHKLGVQQTMVRLVWQVPAGLKDEMQNIVVTAEQAFRIVDYMVLKVGESTDPGIQELSRRAQALCATNIWKSIFACEDNYGRRNIIRMIFNDEVCDPPLLRPENRPLKPIFIYKFTRQEDAQALTRETHIELHMEQFWSSEELADEGTTAKTMVYAKFVEMTAVRQPQGTPVTDWEPPKYKGEQRSMARFQDTSSAPARQGGHIKFRTTAGSNDYGEKKSSKGPGPTREQEPMRELTRHFPGSMEEFKDHIERALQGQDGNTEVDYQKETVTWSSRKGATIIFRQANGRVTITAKEGLCRVYITACSFLQAAPLGSTDSAMERGSTRAANSIRLGGTNAYASSRAPSQAFAPRASSAAGFSRPMSLAGGASAFAGRSAAVPNVKETPKVPYNCEAFMAFNGETTDELTLSVGDLVQVIQDDEENDSLERWVLGKNLKTQSMGWFPLSSTRRVDQAS